MGSDDGHVAAGTRLLDGRYRLGALLGRGGAGRVHEAVDVTLGRTVAVKVIETEGDAVARHRFAAEARLLAGLSHPGLVTVYDVCLDGEPFLVMQLVRGFSLRDLLDRGPLPSDAVARLGARLADALAYVHGRDIVHRDIKPANVLVDEAGEGHLTDFGVARALGTAHLTVSGEFVGTPAYLAPEQITDIDVGPPADIYALGLLLLECLTGHTEYTGTTVEVAVARLNRAPRVPDALPPPWRTLLTAMTARDPAARPDAARCADLLGAIADGRAATRTSPLPVTAVRPRARLPRPRPVHAGLTALALAAACTVAATATTTTAGTPTGEPRPVTSTSAATGTGTGTGTGTATGTATEAAVTPEPASVPQPAPHTPHGRVSPPAAERPAAPAGDNPGKGNSGKKGKGQGKGKSGKG